MAKLLFEQLLEIYKNTDFEVDGRSGSLSIASEDILQTLRQCESDDQAASDSGIAISVEPDTLSIGQQVRIEISPPKLALGILARNFDQLLRAPGALLAEPAAYFVIDGKFHSGEPGSDRLVAYHNVLAAISLFSEAAAYVDTLRQELIFIRAGKFVVPLRYDAALLDRICLEEVSRLLKQFQDETHRDQKLQILADAICVTSQAQSADRRFVFLMENISSLADELRDGYKLFASSFSYAKIRNELDDARIEYVSKIHKTFVDIQGQLLGIPVATIIVASQLKITLTCGLELWTDVAVIGGAWIFWSLLVIAVVNQGLTLKAIAFEIARQKTKLVRDYAAIGDRLGGVFEDLTRRIRWHSFGLCFIIIVATIGAVFATAAFTRVVKVDVWACLTGKVPIAPP